MMRSITFEYKNNVLLQQADLERLGKQLLSEIERMKKAQGQGYQTPYAALAVPYDDQMCTKVHELIERKKGQSPTAVVVIGIGGSNLGAMAIHEALYGTFYNQQHPELAVYFADTVDVEHISAIVQLVEQELQKNNNVLIIIISKSGTTVETVANAEIFVSLLKRYKKNSYADYGVVITDHDSLLSRWAHQQGFDLLEIPALVGGRFSVASAAGLFPLGMLGIDIDQLLAGARSACEHSKQTTIDDNPAALSALLLYIYYKQGYIIHDTFVCSVDLEGVGRWYRQLLGESIGKEYNHKGERVEVGITPTVSVASTDLHSVGQLYLGGPHDKFTSFIRIEHVDKRLAIPESNQLLLPMLAGKELSTIMEAIIQGTQQAYRSGQRPFVSWVLPNKDPFYLGQLFYYKIFEILYLASLLEINPFDQPSVERYKQETRKILKS